MKPVPLLNQLYISAELEADRLRREARAEAHTQAELADWGIEIGVEQPSLEARTMIPCHTSGAWTRRLRNYELNIAASTARTLSHFDSLLPGDELKILELCPASPDDGGETS